MNYHNRIIKKWAPVIIFIVGILLLLAIKLFIRERIITNNINFRLKSSAGTIELVINDSLIEAAATGKQPDKDRYSNMQKKIDRIASIHEVDYVYVVIENRDSVYFVICNILPSDIINNIEIKYLDVFAEAPPELKEAFRMNDNIIFGKNSNKWGTFRSAYIPRKTKGGINYLLCSDKFIRDINKELFRVLTEFLISFIYIILISFPLIYLQVNAIGGKKFKQKP